MELPQLRLPLTYANLNQKLKSEPLRELEYENFYSSNLGP